MSISGSIKGLRKKKGYSQVDLAKLLKVNKHTVGAWERGVQEPRSDHIRTLTKIFGVSADEILGLQKNAAKEQNDGFGLELRFEFRQRANLYIERAGAYGLSDIMQDKGVSCKDLAKQLEVTAKTVSNWQTKGLPGLRNYQKLFTVLDFDADTFCRLQ